MAHLQTNTASKKESFGSLLKKDFKVNKEIYFILIPVALFYIIFSYYPMYGAIMAFKNFVPKNGILGSEWVGFKHFINFFESPYFFRVLGNTLNISITGIIFGFPAPIILALLLNEIRSKRFLKTVQTVTYLPHFISLVVICGMIREFVANNGIISQLVGFFTGKEENLLNFPQYFVTIFVSSGIWQSIGWDSIIYLAALLSIDQELYEAARIDGANRWNQVLNITIPSLVPTIIILLILRLGHIISVGFEKIILLYNPVIYSTSDVISSYVYRTGIQEFNYSFSTAVGLFNSVVSFIFLYTANYISKKRSDTSLW